MKAGDFCTPPPQEIRLRDNQKKKKKNCRAGHRAIFILCGLTWCLRAWPAVHLCKCHRDACSGRRFYNFQLAHSGGLFTEVKAWVALSSGGTEAEQRWREMRRYWAEKQCARSVSQNVHSNCSRRQASELRSHALEWLACLLRNTASCPTTFLPQLQACLGAQEESSKHRKPTDAARAQGRIMGAVPQATEFI